jgi:hypothetical protein
MAAKSDRYSSFDLAQFGISVNVFLLFVFEA